MNAVQMTDEILAGMYEALNGRVPNDATQKKIEELQADRARYIESDWHGWECYCDRCCM